MDLDLRELEVLLRAIYPFGNKYLEQHYAKQANPPTSWETYYETSREVAQRSWVRRQFHSRPR